MIVCLFFAVMVDLVGDDAKKKKEDVEKNP